MSAWGSMRRRMDRRPGETHAQRFERERTERRVRELRERQQRIDAMAALEKSYRERPSFSVVGSDLSSTDALLLIREPALRRLLPEATAILLGRS